MKVYWRNREKTGPCEFAEAEKKAKTNKSKVSNGNIVIGVGKEEIFFYPTEYKIDGFSMTHKELETLVLEACNQRNSRLEKITEENEKDKLIDDLIDKLMDLDPKSREEVMVVVMFLEAAKEVIASKKISGNKKN